ncbi:MAG: TorF family putative porin [Hydrogenophilaceae bacterium]
MKKLVSALILSGLATTSFSVLAEDSPHSLTGNVSLTSNYVFRGISQTGGDMAVQGGLDYAHSSGFYLGTWASNVGWIEDFQGYDSGNVEIDLYGGYRGAIGDSGLTFDVGAIRYMYPGDNNPGMGFPDGDTSEVYGALGWKWFTVKYSYYLTDDVFGITANGSDYWDVGASYPVGETGLTLAAHWGTFSFDDTSVADYNDWSVSATYDMSKLSPVMSGVTVGLKYSDTDASKGFWTDFNNEYLGKSTTTVWISKAL